MFNWIFYLDNDSQNEAYSNELKDLARYYNRLFDSYNTYESINNIKTINDNAGIKAVKVDYAMIEMLDLSKTIYELSNGKFDITQGNLLRIWHHAREKGKFQNEMGQYGDVPDYDSLLNASKHSGFDHLIIDYENQTVYIDDANVSLDVGGIAKGFSVEKIAQSFIDKKLNNASIVGGGNVKTIGPKIDNSPWSVAINDPRNNQEYSYDGVAVLDINNNNSVVTSGNYFNYYLAENDIKIHHIINPDTLYPSTLYDSITVVTNNSGLADALSTSLFNMTIDEGLEFIDRCKDNFKCDIEVFWILSTTYPDEIQTDSYKGLNVYMTEGFNSLIQK